jgi:hypothetical protein
LNKFNILLILVLLTGCAAEVKFNRNKKLLEFRKILKVQTNFTPHKSVYNKLENTICIMEKNTNLIHIFRNEKKINTIGGLGFNDYSFNKLNDITLAPDGNLLALDSFNKVVKKFDMEGKLIAEFNLGLLAKPQIFDITLDETFYIYDGNRKEIVVKKISDPELSFSFGKFMFSNPVSLIINTGFVQVYDIDLNSTLLFNLWGDLLHEYEGNVLSDLDQIYRLEEHFMITIADNEMYAVNTVTWNSFFLKLNNLVLNSSSEVQVFDLIYEN